MNKKYYNIRYEGETFRILKNFLDEFKEEIKNSIKKQVKKC